MPFTFPDPTVQQVVINPETGERWVYLNGVWELSTDQSPAPIPQPSSCTPEPTPTPTDNGLAESIEELQAEIILLRSDIIELRAELSSVITSNLILE